MPNAKKQMPKELEYGNDAMSVVTGADALVILTEWDEFRGLNLAAVKKAMKGSLLFDGRNVYEPGEVKDAGLTYVGVGRGA